jgi:tRNA dimethylallyltransferase
VVAGATATGKTALAVALARRIPGLEIVSGDSRQVYRGMDIGTAKATADERNVAPHHCLDLVDPDDPFTAADFKRVALTALAGIRARGGTACLVGGTGLYLRAVARGLPLEGGARDPAIRAGLEERLRVDGLDALAGELRASDPEGAESIDLRNQRRVVRALERFSATGSALPPEPEGYRGAVCWIGLALPDAKHRLAIRTRAIEQFETGLLEEAERLRTRYPEDLAAFSALGYREAFDVLAGRTDVVTAIEQDVTRTWAYARRQRTWFRKEPGVTWVDAGEGATAAAMAILAPFLEGTAGHDDYPEQA